jgi:3-hydroxyacyl-CoA dehydrogenase
MTGVTNVAVIGTGGIGASWAAYFLAQGLTVHAHDPRPDGEQQLRALIGQYWGSVAKAAGVAADDPFVRLHWSTEVEDAVAPAQFVQENGPESIDLKRTLFARMSAGAPAEAILATSSSSLLISDIQSGTQRPERIVLGHPFSPPHLVPLVEVAGGRATSEEAIEAAIAFYRAIGKSPVRLNREVIGHIANRLQAAVWREAYHLIASGLASAEDVDGAITNGPGLRWAVLGPCAVQHASGGSGGIRSTLTHMGPAMNAIVADLYAGALTPEMFEAVIASTEEAARGKTPEQLVRERDAALIRVLDAKGDVAAGTS